MQIKGSLRMATQTDSLQMLEIYKPFVEKTCITFEYVSPSKEEFSKRVEQITAFYPWLVYEEEGEVLGYAYASPYGTREAYMWSVTLSIYIEPKAQGKGISQYLYKILLKLLKAQGIHNAYAVITLPNLKSERFHEKIGFKKIGVFEKIGYKLGEWRDICYLQYDINTCESIPKRPIPIRELLSIHTIETYL